MPFETDDSSRPRGFGRVELDDTLRHLATWPEGGDRRDYASILRDGLLARYNRLILEPMVLCYNLLHPDQPETDDPSKPPLRIARDEARVKVWGDGKLLATTIAHGPNPRAAKAEAELMALREAALGRSDIPMLGVLDRNDGITLSMIQEDGHYWLVLDQDLSDDPLYGPRLLPHKQYRMRVRIKAFDKKRGTRYALAMRIHDDLRALLMQTMDVHRADYVQRVVLALAGHHISGLEELHDLRASIPVNQLKGELREAHHHNGHGLDNRRANLAPLEVHVHNATHAISPLGFKYGCFSKPVPDVDGGDPLLWMPGPTLITSYGVMGQQGHDGLFPPNAGVFIDTYEPSEPPSWDTPPRCVTRNEVAALAHSQTHRGNLLLALTVLVEADGQGLLSNLKSSKRIDGVVSENTLRRALRLLAENGIVAISSLGGGIPDDERIQRAGVSEHFRLVRPLAMTFFGPSKRGRPARS